MNGRLSEWYGYLAAKNILYFVSHSLMHFKSDHIGPKTQTYATHSRHIEGPHAENAHSYRTVFLYVRWQPILPMKIVVWIVGRPRMISYLYWTAGIRSGRCGASEWQFWTWCSTWSVAKVAVLVQAWCVSDDRGWAPVWRLSSETRQKVHFPQKNRNSKRGGLALQTALATLAYTDTPAPSAMA